MSLKLYVIVAACENMGIGYKNDLPWKLRKELAYFSRMTTLTENPGAGKMNAVLMGRKTWDSVPEKFRPLKDRINVVLSRNEFKGPSNVLTYTSWDDAIKDLSSDDKQAEIDKVWVIGGSHIYKMAIESSLCHRIYLTKILQNFECDVFLPEFGELNYKRITDNNVPEEIQEENGIKYRFEVYEKVN